MFSHAALRDAIGNGPGDDAVATILRIEAGNNHSYRVTLDDGSRRFLKVGTRFPDRFPAEPATMKILRRETRLPIPQVYGTGREPLGYPFAVYEFVADVGGEWMGDFPDDTAERLCREAGQNLAALHEIGLSDCGRISVAETELTVVDALPWREMVEQSLERQTEQLRETPFADRCESLMDRGEQLVERIDFAEIRPALVHGDYRLENLCLDPSADPVTSAVLDWELPTAADPLWDAVMADALLTDGCGIDSKARERLSTAFWEGYDGRPEQSPRLDCYRLLARVRLARHLETEVQEKSDEATTARIREHEKAFDELLD